MRIKPLANKQVMITQSFVIGDPMNKVRMDKNKALVNSASIKTDIKSTCPFLWCLEVLDIVSLRG